MTYPEIRLVDAPTSTARVLFDFNDTTATPRREVMADDFTIGVPQLVGDVDAVDPLYDDRVVSFICRLTGSKPQVAQAQSTLARRMLAPGRGWLWVRMTPTSRLLFFRTYRPQPGDLSFDLIQSTTSTRAERWELDVSLPCKPFAYGERKTLPAQTINNDPTAATNPMRAILPAIEGDAPAPLRISITSPNGSASSRYLYALHTAETARLPIGTTIGSGDGLTAGTDTGAGVTPDAEYTNSSYRQVSFANDSALVSRLSGPMVGFAPGRYRMLLRCAFIGTGGGGGLSLHRFAISSYGRTTPAKVYQGSGGGAPTWIDLGTLELPPSRPANVTDQGPNIDPPFSLLISREGVTGGQVRLDHLVAMPVAVGDTLANRAMFATNSVNYGGTEAFHLDGETEGAWVSTVSTGALFYPSGNPPELAGAFPQATPNAANVLSFFRQVTETGASEDDGLTNTTTVDISYLPRFLYLGDS